MFEKDTYIRRRAELKRLMGNGLLLFIGNNESPANYPANGYAPFRQDSSFLYYFGQHRAPSVSDLAAEVGITKTAPLSALSSACRRATATNRKVHFLPPYRHDTMIQLMDLLGIHPSKQKEAASLELIKAVVKMRATKEPQEIAYIDAACDVGYVMHTTAQLLIKPGVTERFVAGQVDGIARSLSQGNSFGTIFSQHGEIMHGCPSDAKLEAGRLVICDAGCELEDYCSDHTRTMPVSGKFTQRVAKPGVKYQDVHFAVCRLMTDRLKEIGLMKGDTEEAVRAGAHAMFLPHGLGHMMGMDVHDMEGLGQIYVGFDDETRPNLEQFGTNCLRMGRKLEPGFVLTDEPGIYFIPHLIDLWHKEGHCKEFINFDLLETYKDFGGIRIEDDLLITNDGCRFLGSKRIPYHPKELEEIMNNN